MRFLLLLFIAMLSCSGAAPVAVPPLPSLPFPADRAATLQQESAKALGVAPLVTNSVGMKLVLIPPGRFEMGPHGSRRRVALAKAFYLGQYEVTLGQYRRFKPEHKIEGAADDFNVNDRPTA